MRADKIVCTLAACTDIATELARRTTANTTEVNVCEDFESYICDDWRKQYPLRPDQSAFTYDGVLQDRSNAVVRAMLEGSTPPIDSPDDRQSFGIIKEAYAACMNETEIRRVGVAPIVRVLGEVAKIFTINGSAYTNLNSTLLQESDGELRQLLLYLKKVGIDPLLSVSPGRDDKNPDQRIVFVSPPTELTLSKDYYTDNETLSAYHDAMTKVITSIHPSEEARKQAAQVARNVIDFEAAVSSGLPEIDDVYNVKLYYNILSLADTAKLAPVLGLDFVISQLSPANYSNDRMITSLPTHIQAISKVLLATSKETLQTYFMWQVINAFSGTVLAPEIEPLRQFNNKLSGRDPVAFPDRWRTCVRHVSDLNSLGWIVGRFYANEYFSDKGKLLGETLVEYVKKQYQKSIQSLDWLEDSVKAVALKKLDKLYALMGFPDHSPLNITNASEVLHYYDAVTITDDFFANVWNLTLWREHRSWAKLGTPYDREEWGMSPQTVNAYNDPNSNVIAFPAAILQIPYFSSDIPSYLNFGATGWTVGHEVSHSFDNNGRDYDPDGRFGDSWWTNKTDAEFTRRSQCFIDQYGNYSVEGLDGKPLYLDGKQTLGENIADAGGLDTAFLAWQQHRKDFPEQDTDLVGLETWTHEQLFFIGFANQWCSVQKKQSLIGQVFSDVHSPPKFRIKGSLENSRYFKEHFNCPTKEPKCKIW